MRKRRVKDLLVKFVLYYVIFSFFFPKGIPEIYPEQKNLVSIVIWSSVVLIWAQIIIGCAKSFNKRSFFIKKNKSDYLVFLVYFITLILITFIVRGGSINGYQKLFAYPSIFFFTIYNVKKHTRNFLDAVCDISFVLFVLNLIFSKTLFADVYHMTFLGHVQLISQLGILTIFSNLVYYKLFEKKKYRTFISILLVVITMLMTDALSSNIIAVIFCILAMLTLFKKKLLTNMKPAAYVIGWLIASLTIIFTAVYNVQARNNEIRILDFSGRGFVWTSAIEKIEEKPLVGYGVEGATIDVFWSKWFNNSDNFNYAHNQLLQSLLDGGFVSLIAFIIMLYTCIRKISKISNEQIRSFTNDILAMFLLIMVFESPTLYGYMYIFLAICYSLPERINGIKLEGKT